MRIGLSNACLPQMNLEALSTWSSRNEFKSFELIVPLEPPPSGAQGTFVAASRGNKRIVKKMHRILDQHKLTIDSLAVYQPLLVANARERLKRAAHLRRVIKLAGALEVRTVCCALGRNARLSLAENLEHVGETLRPLVQYARDRNVRIAMENDPHIGRDGEGVHGNIAYSPAQWGQIFDRIGERNFGLAFDPAHLVWQQIDVEAAIRKFRDRIFIFHARDIEIDQEVLTRAGNTAATGWWHFRVPGLGSIDWSHVTGTLKEAGYEGPMILVHADPVWSGSEARVQRGLTLGRSHLSKLLA